MLGSIAHDVGKLRKLLTRYGEPKQVQVVYEAGPTGYGLQRELARRGYGCQVIAPSLIPRRAGDLVKTDRRDCRRLAELARAGELRAVWIPEPADEAIREMTDLKGVGLWTAEVYLLFAAGHPDIFPSGDVALRTAAGEAFGLSERPADKALRLMAVNWRPERSIAARLLWAYYAGRHKRDAMPVL